MPTAFKDYLSPELVQAIALHLQKITPSFDAKSFESRVIANDWDSLELKERMSRMSESFHQEMDEDYPGGLHLILKLNAVLLEIGKHIQGIEYLFIPDYVGRFGTSHIEASLSAMREITRLVSCEFAIRPFIINDPDRSFEEIHAWAADENEHVRRLASEGCRPRLPWGIQLKNLVEDPSPIIPILEKLRNDPSLYVRKSVANNLNDISKDHPSLVLKLGMKWKGESSETDWVIKHGLRTLLKASNSDALELIGYAPSESVKLAGPFIEKQRVEIGGELEFQFNLSQTVQGNLTHRIEYAIYFLRSNGTHYRKVFKISERGLSQRVNESVVRKHSFRKITTRKYHAGTHFVSVIVNGKESKKVEFELLQ